jgi:hypothetical protein
MAPSPLPLADRSTSYTWDDIFESPQGRLCSQAWNETFEDEWNKEPKIAPTQGVDDPNDRQDSDEQAEGDEEFDMDDGESDCGCIENQTVRIFAGFEVGMTDSPVAFDRRSKIEGFCRDLPTNDNVLVAVGRNQRERKGKLVGFVYDGENSRLPGERVRPLTHQELLEKLSRKASTNNGDARRGATNNHSATRIWTIAIHWFTRRTSIGGLCRTDLFYCQMHGLTWW